MCLGGCVDEVFEELCGCDGVGLMVVCVFYVGDFVVDYFVVVFV